MKPGQLVAIYIAPRAAAPMCGMDQVRAVPGQGLQGDRYFDGGGTFTEPGNADREVTLVESEAIEAAQREYELTFAPHDTRRNLVTRDVALNHLVGREFRVGGVTLRGLRLCEPCGHLEKLTQAGIKKALIHRGGLRAQVVEGGLLTVGDVIRSADEQE